MTAQREFNHPLIILSKISSIVKNMLNLLAKLHQWLIIDLGRHAKNIGHVILGLCAALKTFDFINAIRTFTTASPLDIKDESIKMIQQCAQIAMLPCDCGMFISIAASPALNILGGVVSVMGLSVVLVTSFWQFNRFQINAEA